MVISSANSASQVLVTKTFTVPPDFLNNAPVGADPGGAFNDDPFGGGGANKSNLITVRQDARSYLEGSGVVFPDGSSAVHSIATNRLIVRNTQNNIDLVDAIVTALNKKAPQNVRIALTQIELNLENSDERTIDMLLGDFNLPGSRSTFASGGQSPTAFGTGQRGENAANWPFIPPGSDVPVGQKSLTNGIRSGTDAIRGNSIDAITDGSAAGSAASSPASSKAASPFAISAPFADPQFQLALRAISQSKNSTVANQPATVTTPGQRSVIEVLREFIYPTEYDPPEIPQTFNNNQQVGVIIDPVNQVIIVIPGQQPPSSFPVTPAHPTAFESRNVGTRLEVEPTISGNGIDVRLDLSVEFTQFEGFINYGTPITDGTTVLTDNRILQPLFKVSRLAQPVVVQDGSNFVIGGIVQDEHEFTQDKVPFLSEVPVVGRLFKGSVSQRRRKAILFFVNVRIIDPSGQPVNRELAGTDDR